MGGENPMWTLAQVVPILYSGFVVCHKQKSKIKRHSSSFSFLAQIKGFGTKSLRKVLKK
jgi:hypothetical protein